MPEARQEDPCYRVGGREVKWAIELVGQKHKEEERHVIIPQDAWPVNENEGRIRVLDDLSSFTFQKYTLKFSHVYSE